MNWINELPGFIVLTGPLWLIIIIVPLSLWIAFAIAKHFKSGWSRPVARIGFFVFIILLPFSDEIAGRIYLDYLCSAEAGVKVYQTVMLPAEYWDEKGEPTFFERNGNFHLGDNYPINYKTENYSELFHIDYRRYQILNTNTGEVLGEVVAFSHWGGWLRREFSAHNAANSCPNGGERFIALFNNVFMRER